LPKPTLHRTLALFEEAGILCREAGGRAYNIGERLSRFGLDVLRNDGGATERRTVLRRVAGEMALRRFTERTITDRQIIASEFDRIERKHWRHRPWWHGSQS
jgi:DNA-binding IclR family transcriptional regulator